MASKCNTDEVLPGVPKWKIVVMPFQRTHMLNNSLYSGMSYRTLGHEFNVNESKIYYIQKKKEEICLSVCKAKLFQKVRR